MACSDYQNECLRVVTIEYLRRFVDGKIQNSAGTSVSISHSLGDSYCLTYGDLTGGTIVQNWAAGTTPISDQDGIIVNPIWAGGNGSERYRDDQLVDQRDLSMMYTRFKSFSVSSPTTDVYECGGTEQLSYTHKYTRYTKSMNTNCAISTSSSEVSDTENSEITWSVPCNWVSLNASSLVATVSTQPETRTASRRCCTVTGSVSFRNTGGTDSTDVCQKALTGDYTNYEDRHYTGVTAIAATSQQFDCCGGTYGITGTGYYFDRYEWVDSCNRIYHSAPYKDVQGTEAIGGGGGCTSCQINGATTASTAGGTVQLTVSESTSGDYAKSGTFSSCDCCSTPNCCDGCSDSASLSLTYHGNTSNSVQFTQSCSQVTTGCCPTHDVVDWSRSDSCNSSTYGSYITIRGTRYDVSKDAYGNCTVVDWDSGRDYEEQEWCCVSCSDSTTWDESACDGHCGETVTQTGTTTSCSPSSNCKDCDCSTSEVSRQKTCDACPPEPCYTCSECSDTDGPNTHHQQGINDEYDSADGCTYVISVKWCVDKLCKDTNCPMCCTGGGNDVYYVGKESSSYTWTSPLNSSITTTVPAKPSGCA